MDNIKKYINTKTKGLYISITLPHIIKLGVKLIDLFSIVLVCEYYISNAEFAYFGATLVFPILSGLISAWNWNKYKIESSEEGLNLNKFWTFLFYIPGLNHIVLDTINVGKVFFRGDSVKLSSFGSLKRTFDLTELILNDGPQAIFQAFVAINKLFISGNSTFLEEFDVIRKGSTSYLLLILGVNSIWQYSIPLALFGYSHLSTLLIKILLLAESASQIGFRIGIFILTVGNLIELNLPIIGEILALFIVLIFYSIPSIFYTSIKLLWISRKRLEPSSSTKTRGFSRNRIYQYQRHQFVESFKCILFYKINWREFAATGTYLLNKGIEVVLISLILLFVDDGILKMYYNINLSWNISDYNLTKWLIINFCVNISISCLRKILTHIWFKKSCSHNVPKLIDLCLHIIYNAKAGSHQKPIEFSTSDLDNLKFLLKRIVHLGHLQESRKHYDGLSVKTEKMVQFTSLCIRGIEDQIPSKAQGHNQQLQDHNGCLKIKNQDKQVPYKIGVNGQYLVYDGLTVNQLLKITYLSILHLYCQTNYIALIGYRVKFKSILQEIALVSLEMNSNDQEYLANPILNYRNFEIRKLSLNHLIDEIFTQEISKMFGYDPTTMLY